MTTCDACGTTLYLKDSVFLNAGTSGDMHETPMLFELGDQIYIEGNKFETLGHARFDYGPGWWDEFYALDGNGKSAWISVDEGEVILQRYVDQDMAGVPQHAMRVGETFEVNGYGYRITERDTATCIAVRGDFPEPLTVGETYKFVNARNKYADILSGEFSGRGAQWYIGRWIDPFDVKPERFA